MTTGNAVMARSYGDVKGDNFGRLRKESCRNMTRKKVEMLMTETLYYPSGKGFVIHT